MQFLTSLAVLGLAAIGHAHIVINTPVPFKESVTKNDNGPLADDGSDFPCKSGGSYTPQGPSTPMALGSSQPLSFTGGATHGGGSCQISVTYDKAPSKSSVWKVIHSIHGGCPMVVDGNFGGSADQIVPTSYTFPIPNELPTGEAVLAWTWFNKIGNREMYMNCAPITITGGSTRRDEESLMPRNATQLVERDIAAYNSLPNMYVANISPDCQTTEGVNIEFPNPGSSLDTILPGSPAPPCGVVGGDAPSPSQPASEVTAAPSTSVAAPTPSASLPGGVFFPVPNPTEGTPTATAAPVTTSAVSSAPVAAPTQATTFTVIPTQASSAAPPAGTDTVGGGSALTGACATEGEWNCIGGTSFQQCGSGTWSVVQQLAAGTACTPGLGAIDIHAIGTKRRNVRFSGAHIRRHLRSS